MAQPEKEEPNRSQNQREDPIAKFLREDFFTRTISRLDSAGGRLPPLPANVPNPCQPTLGSVTRWPTTAEASSLKACGGRIHEARVKEQTSWAAYEIARRSLREKGAFRRCLGALLPRSAIGREIKSAWSEFNQVRHQWESEIASLRRLEDETQKKMKALTCRALPILEKIVDFRDSVAEGAEILRSEARAVAQYRNLQTQADAMCPGSDSLMHPAESDVARGWNRYVKEQRVNYSEHWYPRVESARSAAQSATERRIAWYGRACAKVDRFSDALQKEIQELTRQRPPFWERAVQMCRETLAVAGRSELWTDGSESTRRIENAERILTDRVFEQYVGCNAERTVHFDPGPPQLRVGRFLGVLTALSLGGGLYGAREKIPSWWDTLLGHPATPTAISVPIEEQIPPSPPSPPVELTPEEMRKMRVRLGLSEIPADFGAQFQVDPKIRQIKGPEDFRAPPSKATKELFERLMRR